MSKNESPAKPAARQNLVSAYSWQLSADFEESLWDASADHPGENADRRELRLALMMGGPL